MEKIPPQQELISKDNQYKIASLVAVLRYMPTYAQQFGSYAPFKSFSDESLPLYQQNDRVAESLLYEVSMSNDYALLKKFMTEECPRSFASKTGNASNHLRDLCKKLGFVDRDGELTENAQIAFEHLSGEDHLMQEILAEINFDRLLPLIDEIAEFKLSQEQALDSSYRSVSDRLVQLQHDADFFVGFYDEG